MNQQDMKYPVDRNLTTVQTVFFDVELSSLKAMPGYIQFLYLCRIEMNVLLSYCKPAS